MLRRKKITAQWRKGSTAQRRKGAKAWQKGVKAKRH
jgi:hypothetical protein